MIRKSLGEYVVSNYKEGISDSKRDIGQGGELPHFTFRSVLLSVSR